MISIKRLIILFLCLVLVCPVLLVPAAATSDHVTDTQFDMFVTGLGNLLDSIYDLISSKQDSIIYWVDNIYQDMLKYLDKIASYTKNIDLIRTLIDSVEAYQVTTYEIMIDWYNKMNANLANINVLTKDIRDRLIGWFNNLFIHLGDIKSKIDTLIVGESGAADDFNDQVSTEATEFEENMDIIQDVTRPTIEDIDLDIDKEIPDGEVVKVGQLLGIFFQNQYIYIIFFISFTFSLVSYGIFGKR